MDVFSMALHNMFFSYNMGLKCPQFQNDSLQTAFIDIHHLYLVPEIS